MICYGQFEPINQHTAVGRYLLFVIFKKLISIPAIQICNIFNEVTVATWPRVARHYYIKLKAKLTDLGYQLAIEMRSSIIFRKKVVNFLNFLSGK